MSIKIIFGASIFILVTACKSISSISSFTSPCYHDKGIKSATTTASILSDPTNKRIQIVEYDNNGRPIKREEVQMRVTKFVYDGINLKATLINNLSSFGDPNMEIVDTNLVAKNDEFGRPLVMKGDDGNILYFNYQECEKEIQTYKDKSGNIIHEYKIVKADGILQTTIFIPKNNKEDMNTIVYFNYKLNKKGHWVERKYNYQKDKIIYEKRKLIYY